MMPALSEIVVSQPSEENFNRILSTRVKEVKFPYWSIGGAEVDFVAANKKHSYDDVGIARPRKLKKSKTDSSSAYSASKSSKESKNSKKDDNTGSSRDAYSPVYEPSEFLQANAIWIHNNSPDLTIPNVALLCHIVCSIQMKYQVLSTPLRITMVSKVNKRKTIFFVLAVVSPSNFVKSTQSRP